MDELHLLFGPDLSSEFKIISPEFYENTLQINKISEGLVCFSWINATCTPCPKYGDTTGLVKMKCLGETAIPPQGTTCNLAEKVYCHFYVDLRWCECENYYEYDYDIKRKWRFQTNLERFLKKHTICSKL